MVTARESHMPTLQITCQSALSPISKLRLMVLAVRDRRKEYHLPATAPHGGHLSAEDKESTAVSAARSIGELWWLKTPHPRLLPLDHRRDLCVDCNLSQPATGQRKRDSQTVRERVSVMCGHVSG